MTSRPPSSRAQSTFAFIAYLITSICIFGSRIVLAPASAYIGDYTDPSAFIWDLTWWPHAIVHGLNPFLPQVIWAPTGVNLASAAAIPGPALILSPVTHWFGPVAAYNLLLLTAPPVGAWAAFLLCRYVSRSFWCSLVGGYVFGFSPYELGHMLAGHANLVVIAAIPLLIYFFLLRIDGFLKAKSFYILSVSTLVVQFLTSTELFATLSLFGGAAFLMGAWLVKKRRRDLFKTIPLVVGIYGTVLLVTAPYLYYALASGRSRDIINSPFAFSIDAANFIIPPGTFLGLPGLERLGIHFQSGLFESTGYLGVPLFLLMVSYIVSNWRKPLAKVLGSLLLIVMLMSMGPSLKVGGKQFFVLLPWSLVFLLRVPFLVQALPGRLTVYMFMIAAIIVSVYLAESQYRARQIAWSMLIVLFLFPALPWPVTPVDTPMFFRTGIYKQYIKKNEIVLVLPFGRAGNSMLWQAQTGMYFRMAGGYVGKMPTTLRRWLIVHSLLSATDMPGADRQLTAFIRQRGIRCVIVAYHGNRVWNGDVLKPRIVTWDWKRLLSQLGVLPIRVADVLIYPIPRSTLEKYPKSSGRNVKS